MTLIAAALAVAVASMVAVTPAHAWSANYRLNNSDYNPLHGERTGLQTPGGDPSVWNIMAGNGGVVSLIMESVDGNSWAEAGYVQLNQTTYITSECGSDPGQIRAVVTYANESQGFTVCKIIDGGVGNNGSETHTFAVRRDSTGSTYWGMFYDGTEKGGALNLGFDPADSAFIYGVYSGQPSTCNSNTSVWAKSVGATPWAWTSDVYPHATTWHTLSTDSSRNDPGNIWTLGALPSPFDLIFSCPT